MSKEHQLAYREGLAFVHDMSACDFSRDSVKALLPHFRQRGWPSGRLIDLGCGTGVFAEKMVDAGYNVTGVDISAGMIDIARERVPTAEFVVESAFDYEIPSCDIVTALGEVLGYMFDASSSRTALKRVIRRAFAALSSNGLFVLDLANTSVDKNRPPSFWDGDGWTCLVAYERDERRKILTRNIITYRQVGEYYRRDSEVHRLKLYDPPEVTKMLREAGFRVSTFRKLGEWQMLPNRNGYLARKP